MSSDGPLKIGKFYLLLRGKSRVKEKTYVRRSIGVSSDERLKTKTEGTTRHAYTGLREGREHLKIKTRLIYERVVSVMGECDLESIGDPSGPIDIQ